ncbi:HEPN domain-containing protein [Chryseobacterium sp.]|uniref:HEPN domain-containing protein n=1 Tax=Chryseobacterium sp. TaxID=1871047 RepID=UPI0011CB3C97|nr:HEPN domain-containing protein [Chryseobacterium sp.]TXF75025.1 hypothetical protein FUA25_12165 [Chryseobacterium sp.]
MELEKNTVITFSGFTLTNSLEYISQNLILNPLAFQESFGMLAFSNFLDPNGCYLFHKSEMADASSPHKSASLIAVLLHQLWHIRDNSVFVKASYILANPTYENLYLKNDLQFYDCCAKRRLTKFNQEEIISIVQTFKKRDPFIQPRQGFKVEEIGSTTLNIAQESYHHNDLNRIERAELFLTAARKSAALALIITNKIAFLECLFSTTGIEISHQVSERVAIFVHKYDTTYTKQEIYDIVKKCYAIRSKYVHGDKLDKHGKTNLLLSESSIKLDELCRLILNAIYDNNLRIFLDDELLPQYFRDLVLPM